MKSIDAIGISIIMVGIMMTAVIFFATRGPSSDVINSEIHEITPGEPPAHKQFGQPISDKPHIKLPDARQYGSEKRL